MQRSGSVRRRSRVRRVPHAAFRVCALFVATCLLVGCEPGVPERVRAGTYDDKIPESPAIDRLLKEKPGMEAVYRSAEQGLGAVREFVQRDDFVSRVEGFAAEPPPSGFESPERVARKEAVVRALRELIDGARTKVPDAEFQKRYDAVRPAWNEFMQPLD